MSSGSGDAAFDLAGQLKGFAGCHGCNAKLTRILERWRRGFLVIVLGPSLGHGLVGGAVRIGRWVATGTGMGTRRRDGRNADALFWFDFAPGPIPGLAILAGARGGGWPACRESRHGGRGASFLQSARALMEALAATAAAHRARRSREQWRS